jgi:hypothetical protein
MSRRAAVLLIGLAVAAGCNRSGPALPDTVQAKGKVLLPSGQPLTGGRLEFKATAPPSIDAFADVQKDGSFVVQSFTQEGGAVPGNYVVVVSPFDYHTKDGNPRKIANASSIPSKYQEASTSDLKVSIERGQENALTLQLKR